MNVASTTPRASEHRQLLYYGIFGTLGEGCMTMVTSQPPQRLLYYTPLGHVGAICWTASGVDTKSQVLGGPQSHGDLSR